MMMTT
jgi:hypothetical protein